MFLDKDHEKIPILAKGTSNKEAIIKFHQNILLKWLEKADSMLPKEYEDRFNLAYNQAKAKLPADDEILLKANELYKKWNKIK